MTEPTDAPTLGPGPELTRMTAALAYATAQALQRRRAERGRGDGDEARAGLDEPRRLRDDPVVTTSTGVDSARAHGRGDGRGDTAVGLSSTPDRRAPDVAALLGAALPPEVVAKVRASRGYSRLVDELHE
ncbi:MAG: hypothetical protein ACT4RN_06375 [Pseudonocardia sp.]